jgi:hypothetical protein
LNKNWFIIKIYRGKKINLILWGRDEEIKVQSKIQPSSYIENMILVI